MNLFETPILSGSAWKNPKAKMDFLPQSTSCTCKQVLRHFYAFFRTVLYWAFYQVFYQGLAFSMKFLVLTLNADFHSSVGRKRIPTGEVCA